MSWLRGVFLAVFTALIAALGLGFLSFARNVEVSGPPVPLPEADAIVALTGGATAERLTTAMGLLSEGRGRRLLISGVNARVTDKQIYAVLDGPAELVACCVDLGRQAEDTLGNASETAAWAHRNGFARIIVVTDDYHMPRSLTELRVAMPAAQLIAYPVRTRVAHGGWKQDAGAATRLGGEYVKFLLVSAREALLNEDHAPKVPPAA